MKTHDVTPPSRMYVGFALADQDVLEDIARRQRLRSIPGDWLRALEAEREGQARQRRDRARQNVLRMTGWGALAVVWALLLGALIGRWGPFGRMSP